MTQPHPTPLAPDALLAAYHGARMALVRTPELDTTFALTSEVIHHRTIWDVLGALCLYATSHHLALRLEYRTTIKGGAWWIGLGTTVSLLIPKPEDGATQAFQSRVSVEGPIMANCVVALARAIGLVPDPTGPQPTTHEAL